MAGKLAGDIAAAGRGQEKVDLEGRQGREARRGAENLELGRHRLAQQGGDREASRDGGVDGILVGDLQQNAPVAASRAQRLHDDRTEAAVLAADGNRQGCAPVSVAAGRADPDEIVGHEHLASADGVAVGGQRQVDAAAGQVLDEVVRVLGDEADLHAGKRRVEAAQDRRHVGRDEVDGDAEAHLAFEARRVHALPHLVVEGDDAAGEAEQALAGRGEREALVLALEQRLAEAVLEPLQLQADGGLGAIEQARGGGDAASLDDGEKGPEQADIEIAMHGISGAEIATVA